MASAQRYPRCHRLEMLCTSANPSEARLSGPLSFLLPVNVSQQPETFKLSIQRAQLCSNGAWVSTVVALPSLCCVRATTVLTHAPTTNERAGGVGWLGLSPL